MNKFLTCAEKAHKMKPANIHNTNDEAFRFECIEAMAEMFQKQPPPKDVIFDYITMLLSMPVFDRIYLQRAYKPLSEKIGEEAVKYRNDLSRELQSTDAWTDLNILNDKHRKALIDEGLETNPTFKFP